MHAAYVLLLVLHTCRLHICAPYEYMHAACEQEGTNWSCVHQDFLHSTHLLACGYVSLECSTLEFDQKMRAECVQHFCEGLLAPSSLHLCESETYVYPGASTWLLLGLIIWVWQPADRIAPLTELNPQATPIQGLPSKMVGQRCKVILSQLKTLLRHCYL